MSVIRATTPSPSTWYLLITRLLRLALPSMIIIAFSSFPRQVSTAQTNWQWYKTDLHVHSAFSGEAFDDLGILSQAAKSLGYNALFLTDHNLASSFPISGLTANRMLFEDSYRRWTLGIYGSPSSTTNALAAAPVNTGTNSLHLASSSSGSGETYVWTNRGPNFRSGDIILKVSIYPTRIDQGSGVYVSAAIGGDVTVQSPDGYTTSSGVISPSKSTVLVWQIGSARTASTDPNTRVLTYSLGPYTLNAWNHYTINISDYLANIPPADRPLDYNGLTYLKMAAAANGGTADAYFDTYSIVASTPVPPADEFAYRSSVIRTYDTSTFKIFPSVELGTSKHAQRLNFDITVPSQFVSYTNGIDGILPAQQSGYPAMLNHPGSDGGVSSQEAISTQGEGADMMEVRQQGWIDNWDAVLQQGVQLLGTGTTDTHRVFSGSSFATYVYGPELTFDSLVHSIFEGRTYIAVASSGDQGRLIFNLNNASQEPYPARYPIYVSDAQATANVHMMITAGLQNGSTMRWYRNGTLFATDNWTSTSYDATKSVSLSGAFTYVRAEVRSSSGSIKGLTQPIFFVDVPGLPIDKSFRVDRVTTANGNGYNKLLTKGITTANWDVTNSILSMTLENPVNALVNLLVASNSAPQQVIINGAAIAASSTLTNFEAATNSAWYYDAPTNLLYLKVKHPVTITNVAIGFGGTFPTPTPTTDGHQIEVFIDGVRHGSYSLGMNQSLQQSYAGVDNGPVKVVSEDGTPLIASERIVTNKNPSYSSYTEFMGIPASKLTDTYLFPWYNNVGLDSQLRFGNVGTAPTSVTVKIGGVVQGSYSLAPNESMRVMYTSLDDGPVEVKSSGGVPIIASMRVNLKTNDSISGYSEFIGVSGSASASTKYLFPWYNNVGLDSQLRFGNVGTAPTSVTVKIGGVVQGSYSLAPNESMRVMYTSLDDGPVEVKSSGGVPIIVSMRIVLKQHPTLSSYSEFIGLSGTTLTDTKYLFPWYNNVGLDSQLRFGNVGTAPTTVTVKIGGVVQDSYSLAPNESMRVMYTSLDNGPVEVESSGGVPIIVSMRIVLKHHPEISSYTEFMGLSMGAPLGLPGNQLSDTYWFPWYNNVGLDSQLRFGIP